MSLRPIEGRISAEPIAHNAGRHGTVESRVKSSGSGTVSGTESPQNAAMAEVGNLITSLGSLSAQAQSLPLTPPTLPGLPQGQGDRPQSTDYTQFSSDAD